MGFTPSNGILPRSRQYLVSSLDYSDPLREKMCCSDDDRCQTHFCLCQQSCPGCQSCWPCTQMRKAQLKHPEIVDQAYRKIARRYAEKDKCKFGIKAGFNLKFKIEFKFQIKAETYMALKTENNCQPTQSQNYFCNNCQCPLDISSTTPKIIPTAPPLPEMVST